MFIIQRYFEMEKYVYFLKEMNASIMEVIK